MNHRHKYSGFTFIEIMVVVVILAILTTGIITVGAYVRKKAQIRETKGYIHILSSALQEYKNYQKVEFTGYPADGGTGYYYDLSNFFSILNKVPSCRTILDKIPPEKRNDFYDSRVDPPVPGQDGKVDTVLDAWGMPMVYFNKGSGIFPTVRSAGPDKLFDNADDITSGKL